MKTQKLAQTALLSATAIIFGYIETLLPSVGIPGIKLGLSNIVILLAIYKLSIPSALFIMLIKVLVTSLLFSGLNVFFFSLCGGVLSITAMILFKNRSFSVVGVSILGGVFHNIGQILVAGFVLGTSVFYYLPILLISGCITGFLTGYICNVTMKHLKNGL